MGLMLIMSRGIQTHKPNFKERTFKFEEFVTISKSHWGILYSLINTSSRSVVLKFKLTYNCESSRKRAAETFSDVANGNTQARSAVGHKAKKSSHHRGERRQRWYENENHTFEPIKINLRNSSMLFQGKNNRG